MSKKKRTYNPNRVCIDKSYSVQEIAELYGVHKNTIFQWVKLGLITIDKKKPYLIHGSVLKDFLQKKRVARKHKCKSDEFYCCKCRVPRKACGNVADIIIKNESKLSISGLCAVCNTVVYRAGSVKKIDEYKKTFSIQTIQDQPIYACNNPIVNSDMREDE